MEYEIIFLLVWTPQPPPPPSLLYLSETCFSQHVYNIYQKSSWTVSDIQFKKIAKQMLLLNQYMSLHIMSLPVTIILFIYVGYKV